MPASTSEPPVVVIDAGIAVSSVLDVALSDVTSRAWGRWRASNVEVLAPQLWLYEATTAIRKALAFGSLQANEAEEALTAALALKVTLVSADDDLCRSALRWAERLKQRAAYDGFYLALAGRLQADFWSADQRLINAARQTGVRWVHWVGELEVTET